MKTSAIIVTLNEEKYLPKVLDSLAVQTHKVDEIIVVDAGSVDKTTEIARKGKCKLILHHPPVGGQRNIGGKMASGDVLFFFDSDVKIPNDYVEKCLRVMKKNTVELICPQYVPFPGTKSEKITFKIINGLFWLAQKITPSGGGSGIVVTKKLFNRAGGFKGHFVYDDIEFIRRAARKGKFVMAWGIVLYVSDRRFKKYGIVHMTLTYILLSFFFALGFFKLAEVIKYSFGGYNRKIN